MPSLARWHAATPMNSCVGSDGRFVGIDQTASSNFLLHFGQWVSPTYNLPSQFAQKALPSEAQRIGFHSDLAPLPITHRGI